MAGRPKGSATNEKGQFWCGRCKQFKDPSDFYPAPPSHRGQKSQNCKACGVEAVFICRTKRRLKELGPEKYLEELKIEEARLHEKFQLLLNFKMKGEG